MAGPIDLVVFRVAVCVKQAVVEKGVEVKVHLL